jgi:hypothetical protein
LVAMGSLRCMCPCHPAMVCSFVTHYGGWVVPDPLLDTLQRYVYVCTAVTNETLAYDCRSSGKKVAVSINTGPAHLGIF